MIEIIYILKIFLYFFILYMIQILAQQNKKFIFRRKKYPSISIDQNEHNQWKLSLFSILVIAFMLASYSVICGATPETIDRARYAHRFEHNIYEERKNSEALFWVEYFITQFTKNPQWLFFSITLLCVVITLIAYNLYKETNPTTLVYLGFTQYFFYTFYQLKQAPAIALVAISFWCFLNKKKILCVLTLALSIQFHEVSYVAVPIYLVLLGRKKKWVWVSEIIILGAVTIAFAFFTKTVVSVANLVPGLGTQIARYVNESGSINVNTHFATAVKGAPLYYLVYWGIRKRHELVEKIDNYDKYLIITVFSSFMVLLSIYNYWMWRLGTVFLFPICVYATKIKDSLQNSKEKRTFHYGFLFSYAFFTVRVIFQYYFKYGGF